MVDTKEHIFSDPHYFMEQLFLKDDRQHPIILLLGFISITTQIILIGVTIVLCRKCFQLGLEKTAKHAYYCTLGFFFFISECLMVHNGYGIFWRLMSLRLLCTIHIIFAIAAATAGIYGIIVKYVQKEDRTKEPNTKAVKHFQSRHGFYGIAGSIFFIVTCIMGIITYFTDNHIILESIHRVLGLTTYILIAISQVFGFNTGFARRNISLKSINWYKFLTIVVSIITAYGPVRHLVLSILYYTPSYVFTKFGIRI